MNQAQKCPVCKGKGDLFAKPGVFLYHVTCHGCGGKGWVQVGGEVLATKIEPEGRPLMMRCVFCDEGSFGREHWKICEMHPARIELDKLRRHIEKLRRHVIYTEWARYGHDEYVSCFWCREPRDDGHKDGCTLVAILEETRP